MSAKENLITLLIGFTFAGIYVGTMVTFPLTWAFGNLILLPVAIYLNHTNERFKRTK